jgi:hypothetical protein
MNEIEFTIIRETTRKAFAEKTIAELRAMKLAFENLNRMNPKQRQLMIDDLTLMEHYKTGNSHSLNEEFDRIMRGF